MVTFASYGVGVALHPDRGPHGMTLYYKVLCHKNTGMTVVTEFRFARVVRSTLRSFRNASLVLDPDREQMLEYARSRTDPPSPSVRCEARSADGLQSVCREQDTGLLTATLLSHRLASVPRTVGGRRTLRSGP
jgi:hypothetical protein